MSRASWLYIFGRLPESECPPEPPPTDRSQLGAQAKRLIDDPVLALAFERLGRDLAAAWRNTKADDTAGRERAYHMQWALEGVRAKLRAMLDDAKMLAAEQKRQEAEAASQR